MTPVDFFLHTTSVTFGMAIYYMANYVVRQIFKGDE